MTAESMLSKRPVLRIVWLSDVVKDFEWRVSHKLQKPSKKSDVLTCAAFLLKGKVKKEVMARFPPKRATAVTLFLLFKQFLSHIYCIPVMSCNSALVSFPQTTDLASNFH